MRMAREKKVILFLKQVNIHKEEISRKILFLEKSFQKAIVLKKTIFKILRSTYYH